MAATRTRKSAATQDRETSELVKLRAEVVELRKLLGAAEGLAAQRLEDCRRKEKLLAGYQMRAKRSGTPATSPRAKLEAAAKQLQLPMHELSYRGGDILHRGIRVA